LRIRRRIETIAVRLVAACLICIAAVAVAEAAESDRAASSLPAEWAARTSPPAAPVDYGTSARGAAADPRDATAELDVERATAMPHASAQFGADHSYAIPAAETFGFAFLLNQVNRHTDGTDFGLRRCSERPRGTVPRTRAG
jgi:hypothetical protein